MFLFQQIDSIRDFSPIAYKELPDYIPTNLNPTFELRPYQENAFRNFITFYESDKRPNPTQVLFHMATGSGKTLIMAGLIIYLYKLGYRNFLFFVNLDNIVQKTKDNFLNAASAKYLFAEQIVIDGETIKINEVSNFQGTSPDAINICFTTTQGLHSDMWSVKEGAPSFDDFSEVKTVLISDEAHHLNVDTRKGKKSTDDDSSKSWEYTVNRIFGANRNISYDNTRNSASEFKSAINGIFEKTGLQYTLTDHGMVERVVDNGIQLNEIESTLIQIKEKGLKELLDDAILAYKTPHPSARQGAVEKIWDALERLKTYYTALDKKNSADKIVSDMANGQADFINLFNAEFKALTDIGNNFRIRHHETSKIDITDSMHYDYFFNRCLALIALAVQYLQ